MAEPVSLADKLGELGQSLSKIQETVQANAAEFVGRVEKNDLVSAELKEKTDKALSELGETITRISALEKQMARESDGVEEGPKSLGDLVLENEQVKSGVVNGAWRGAIRVRGERAAITSANTTVGAGRSDGTSLVPATRVPGIFALAERQMTIRDLLMQGETASNSVEYVKETGFTNSAAPVAEGAAKPYSDITFNMATAPVRTIAHLFKASRQILDDAPALRSYIDGRARYGLRMVEENQLLNGSGTGQNILGLVPQATAFAAAFTPAAATALDRVRLAILQAALAEFPATGIVLHPTDWAKIQLTKDAGGNYIIGNPQSGLGKTLWNLPVVDTQAIAVGKMLVGGFAYAAQIFDRMEIEVLLSSENTDDFEKNMFTIRAEERLGLAVYRPESLVYGDVNP